MPANFADLLSTEVTPDKDFRFFGQLHAQFERLGQEVDGQRENLAKIQVRLCYIMTPLLLVLIYNWFFGTPTNELYAMSFALSITVIAQLGLNIDNRPFFSSWLIGANGDDLLQQLDEMFISDMRFDDHGKRET